MTDLLTTLCTLLLWSIPVGAGLTFGALPVWWAMNWLASKLD